MNTIYGPLYSRRLGISVGIDIIPYKTCSFNCVYCHEGETTNLTCQRQNFLDFREVLEELSSLAGKKQLRGLDLDYLTFAGSGEPTLNRDLGRYIAHLKEISPVPVAVITNSSLLWDRDVRDDLRQADLVVPSLDAAGEESFQRVNRPCKELSLEKIFRGLRQFCREFSGEIWLEILLCRGLNDSEADLARLAEVLETMELDKVQINTVSRPPAQDKIEPVPPQTLRHFREQLAEKVEIIEESTGFWRKAMEADLEKAILDRLNYKPESMLSLSRELKKSGQEIIKVLARLEKEGKVVRFIRDRTSFYRKTPGAHGK